MCRKIVDSLRSMTKWLMDCRREIWKVTTFYPVLCWLWLKDRGVFIHQNDKKGLNFSKMGTQSFSLIIKYIFLLLFIQSRVDQEPPNRKISREFLCVAKTLLFLHIWSSKACLNHESAQIRPITDTLPKNSCEIGSATHFDSSQTESRRSGHFHLPIRN